jgi:hypothetical protein
MGNSGGNFNGVSGGAGCALDSFAQKVTGRQRGTIESIARGALSGSSLGVVPGYGLALNSAANVVEVIHHFDQRSDEIWRQEYMKAGMTEDQAFRANMCAKHDL